MKPLVRLLVLAAWPAVAHAQALVPAAYTPAPIDFNVVTITGVFSTGDLSFDPTLPIEDGRATLGASIVTLARTLDIGGRYANVLVGVPFAAGTVSGRLSGEFQEQSRAGMGDLVTRVGVNLYGAPAMTVEQFRTYRPRTIVGVSLGAVVPTGQYDNARYINIGTNRWAFSPEIGISRHRGRWTFEGDFGLTFFADNTDYVGDRVREQAMIASFQGHLIYTLRPGFWVAADGNFWKGGRITVDGDPNVLDQKNSRLGITAAVPVRRHQFRFSYSLGAYTTIGGDYHSIGMSYSRAWAGRR